MSRPVSPAHQARVATYAALVASGRRLFEPTPEQVPECDRPNRRACIGCGRAARAGWGKGSRPHGWAVRRLAGAERHGTEIHCPQCLRRWGWGEGNEGWPKLPEE